ncbi:uncharacterized protein MICPUCDRAFT_486, partial [Micromonas pusilla CCMP1545]
LVASMSSDASARQTAEAQLTQGGTQPGFGVGLARVSLNQALPYGTRQLAAVVLKKYVKEHWQEGEGRHVPPQTSDEEKAAMREILPAGLGDPIAKIRTAVGMAIASIAAWDWPHAWPALTPTLLNAVKARQSEDAVLGALRCLQMICVDMEEAQIPQVVFSLALKRRALAVLHSCLTTLGMMSAAKQRAVRDLMIPLLPPWLDFFSRALATAPAADAPEQCSFVLEALRCLAPTVMYFAKPAGDAILPPLRAAATLFHALAGAYEANHVDAESDAERDRRVCFFSHRDGEDASVAHVVLQLLELVMTLVEHPRLSATLESGLAEMIYRAIGYMRMTASQEESWGDDPNQYVADEDDDMSSARATCGMLLDELVDRFGDDAQRALSVAVERRLSEAELARANGEANWWKTREATLLAVGVVSDALIEGEAAARSENVAPSFAASVFLANVLERDLSSGATAAGAVTDGGESFLRGRALWVAARLAPGAPPAAAGAALAAALASLRPTASAPLRVGACRALAQYVPLAPKDVLRPFLAPAYQGLGSLLESAAGSTAGAGSGDALEDGYAEDALHLVLEAMLVVVKADADAATQWSSALAPATLRVWAEKVADPLLAADARDVLEALAAVPAEAHAAHAACFRHVVAIALTSDDVGALQSAAECLRAFLRAGGDDALLWGVDGQGGGGDVLRQYLDAAARLLSPSLEDGAAVFAAPLLGQMLRRLPTRMAPVLPEIVSATATRIRAARQPNLIAALLSEGADGIPPPTTALELVTRLWIAHQSDVQGAFDIKLTTSALAVLLASGNPTLGSVGVKGEPVAPEGGGGGQNGGAAIRTRARAKAAGPEKFSLAPLPVKMLDALADFVLEAQEAASAREDDEWED